MTQDMTPTTPASPTSHSRRSLPILPPVAGDVFDRLDDIRIASPCTASWADMIGSERVRFCGACQKNVYHLSGMRRDEAIDLLRATEGRVCVRFFRRADGTVLTEDCPVGVERVLRRAKRATFAAAALSIGAVAAVLAMLGGSFTRRTCERLARTALAIEAVIPDPLVPMQGEPPPPDEAIAGKPMMGDVAMPPPRRAEEPGELMGRVAPPSPAAL